LGFKEDRAIELRLSVSGTTALHWNTKTLDTLFILTSNYKTHTFMNKVQNQIYTEEATIVERYAPDILLLATT
jgi:hypothetical protein